MSLCILCELKNDIGVGGAEKNEVGTGIVAINDVITEMIKTSDADQGRTASEHIGTSRW